MVALRWWEWVSRRRSFPIDPTPTPRCYPGDLGIEQTLCQSDVDQPLTAPTHHQSSPVYLSAIQLTLLLGGEVCPDGVVVAEYKDSVSSMSPTYGE